MGLPERRGERVRELVSGDELGRDAREDHGLRTGLCQPLGPGAAVVGAAGQHDTLAFEHGRHALAADFRLTALQAASPRFFGVAPSTVALTTRPSISAMTASAKPAPLRLQ